MRILGIDPGTIRVGYGFIESAGGDLRAIDYGLLDISRGENLDKLLELGQKFQILLKKSRPDLVAIEKLYFTKNQKTGIAVAEARGVLRFISGEKHLPILEYGPQEIKLAVTSDGRADKLAVKNMVCRMLGLKKIKGPDDITDALAIAITASARVKWDLLNKKY